MKQSRARNLSKMFKIFHAFILRLSFSTVSHRFCELHDQKCAPKSIFERFRTFLTGIWCLLTLNRLKLHLNFDWFIWKSMLENFDNKIPYWRHCNSYISEQIRFRSKFSFKLVWSGNFHNQTEYVTYSMSFYIKHSKLFEAFNSNKLLPMIPK